MKNKVAIIALLAMCLMLSSCQLALTDIPVDDDGQLIGVFVSSEPLNLFDIEGYVSNNVSALQDGSLTVGGDTRRYEGKLYATQSTTTLTSDATGQAYTVADYTFEGADGASFFLMMETDPVSGEPSHALFSDDAISDTNCHLSVTDEGTSDALEGTLYVVPGRFAQTFYFNPVFQQADGSVYAAEGSGFSINTDIEGTIYTQTLEETTTVTENGTAQSRSLSVKLSIEVRYAPEQILLVQMDTNHAVIAQDSYLPGELPDALTLDAQTAYLVAETQGRNADNTPHITRTILDAGSKWLDTFCAAENGMLIHRQTELHWDK